MSFVRSPRSLVAAGAGLVLGTALAISLAAPASADVLPIQLPTLPLPTAGTPGTGTPGGTTPNAPTSLLPITCVVTVHTPATLAIGASHPSVPMSLSRSGCNLALINTGTDVTLNGPNGVHIKYQFPTVSKPVNVEIPKLVGTFASSDGHAGFDNANSVNLTVAWQYSQTRVKFYTHAAMATSRKGRTVRFTGYAAHFSAVQNRFAGYPGQTVLLEKHTARGWEIVRAVRADAKGNLRASITASGRADYRWSVRETARTWSTVSTTHRV